VSWICGVGRDAAGELGEDGAVDEEIAAQRGLQWRPPLMGLRALDLLSVARWLAPGARGRVNLWAGARRRWLGLSGGGGEGGHRRFDAGGFAEVVPAAA
jgi:hypothetical protein